MSKTKTTSRKYLKHLSLSLVFGFLCQPCFAQEKTTSIVNLFVGSEFNHALRSTIHGDTADAVSFVNHQSTNNPIQSRMLNIMVHIVTEDLDDAETELEELQKGFGIEV